MFNIVISFLIGCTFTYIATIISSAIKASSILEDAMLTYAILMMSAYEVSVSQLETIVIAERIPRLQSEGLRKANIKEFETFANKRIEELLKTIPSTHTNIIRYRSFSEMNSYVTKQLRRQNAKSKQKR